MRGNHEKFRNFPDNYPVIENLDPLLPDFQLSEEQIQQLVAFLGALSDPDVATLPDIDIPNSVPSGLPVAD